MTIGAPSAIVTGGGSGLGQAATHSLVSLGYLVTSIDHRPASSADDSIGTIYSERADVTDDPAIAQAIARAVGRGPLRVAINCAGFGASTSLLDGDAQPSSVGLFRDLIEVNLLGTIIAMRHEASLMAKNEPDREGQRGVIINVSSIAAVDGAPSLLGYAASKAGVEAITLPAARQLGPFGIRVMCIAPGYFATPSWLNAPNAQRDQAIANVPTPERLGQPCEFAALVTHIVDNQYLNGTTIRLDAGVRL